jgi:hypothetical protein
MEKEGKRREGELEHVNAPQQQEGWRWKGAVLYLLS